MIKAGYRDMEIWGCVTPKNSQPAWTERGWRTEWVPHNGNHGQVIDLDGTAGIINAHDVYQKIRESDIHCPRSVYTTSPGHFHIPLWSGDKHWTIIDKVKWIAGWSDVDPALYKTNYRFFADRCSAAGVDMTYFLRSAGDCEYRVPGSVNFKRSLNDINQIEEFVLVGETIWDSKLECSRSVAWNLPKKEGDVLQVIRVPGKNPENSKTPAIPSEPLILLEEVEKQTPYIHLLNGFRKAHKALISQYLYSQIGRLDKGNCQINQCEFARMLGITQPAASKLLRQLVLKEILTITDGTYITTVQAIKSGLNRGRSKTYGLGRKLQTYIQENKKAQVGKKPYVRGNTFHESNRDIRVLCAADWEIDDIAEFCYKKSLDVNGKSRESLIYFKSRAKNWKKKLDRMKAKNDAKYVGPSGQSTVGKASQRYNNPPIGLEHSFGTEFSRTDPETLCESI